MKKTSFRFLSRRPGYFVGAILAAAALVTAGTAKADPIQWTVAGGGNGDYFERIDQTGLSLQAAETDAAALTFDGMTGELAQFDLTDPTAYDAERDFVFTNVYSPGISNNAIYWLGAFLPAGSSTWNWIDGDPIPSAISNGFDVDHAEGAGDEGGGFFQTGSDTIWDYIATDSTNQSAGYIVEFAPSSAPEPASLAVLASGCVLLMARRRSSHRVLPSLIRSL